MVFIAFYSSHIRNNDPSPAGPTIFRRCPRCCKVFGKGGVPRDPNHLGDPGWNRGMKPMTDPCMYAMIMVTFSMNIAQSC